MRIIIFSRVFRHLKSFWLPWLLLIAMLVVACWHLCWSLYLILALAFAFIVMLVVKPMNIIYGLIGTRGDISYFFMLFLLINILFSLIYYEAFFKNAGITYETNQPHMEFGAFKNVKNGVLCLNSKDVEVHLPETIKDANTYYRTTFDWVLRNTLLTSLMQEPTDFFSATATYTGDTQTEKDPNHAIAEAFHWFLIFHILISWILLGVFISLIYQRFRNT